MMVKFLLGRHGRDHDASYRARRANTGRTACVFILPRSNGYWLEMHRSDIRTIMTDAVVAAIAAKSHAEIGPKPKPNKRWEAQPVSPRTEFSVPISKRTLEEWKEFLTDLLSKPESWVRLPVGPRHIPRWARERLGRLQEEKQEAKLQRELRKKIFEAGYRALAVKFHPDKGGSPEDMVRLNQVIDEFRASLKGEIK